MGLRFGVWNLGTRAKLKATPNQSRNLKGSWPPDEQHLTTFASYVGHDPLLRELRPPYKGSGDLGEVDDGIPPVDSRDGPRWIDGSVSHRGFLGTAIWATPDCYSQEATMERELMAPITHRTTRFPSGVASPVVTNHRAKGFVFVTLKNGKVAHLGDVEGGVPHVEDSHGSATPLRTTFDQFWVVWRS